MKAANCRLCAHRATRGAFTWKDPKQSGKWLFVLLCEAHGREFVAKGAKKLSWRPRPGVKP